jgi:hypothetical protein
MFILFYFFDEGGVKQIFVTTYQLYIENIVMEEVITFYPSNKGNNLINVYV